MTILVSVTHVALEAILMVCAAAAMGYDGVRVLCYSREPCCHHVCTDAKDGTEVHGIY